MGIQNVWIVVPQRQHHKTEAPPPPAAGSKAELKDYRRRVRLSRASAQWLVRKDGATTSRGAFEGWMHAAVWIEAAYNVLPCDGQWA